MILERVLEKEGKNFKTGKTFNYDELFVKCGKFIVPVEGVDNLAKVVLNDSLDQKQVLDLHFKESIFEDNVYPVFYVIIEGEEIEIKPKSKKTGSRILAKYFKNLNESA